MEALIVAIVFLFVFLILTVIILGPIALLIAGVVLIARAVSGGKPSPPAGPVGEGKPLANGNMNDYLRERRRILDMVASGQVSPEEGERLLAALEQKGVIAQGQGLLHQTKMHTNWLLIIAGTVLILFILLPVLFQLLAVFLPAVRLHLPNWPHLPTLPTMPAAPGALLTSLRTLSCGQGLISLLFLAFWIWMLVDCLRQPTDAFARIAPLTRGGEYDKLIWVIGLILLNVIAAVVYFFVIYRPVRKR